MAVWVPTSELCASSDPTSDTDVAGLRPVEPFGKAAVRMDVGCSVLAMPGGAHPPLSNVCEYFDTVVVVP